MENLHILPKSHELNTIKQCEIYKHHKQNKSHILNDHLHTHIYIYIYIYSLTPYSTPKIIKQLLTLTILFPTPTINHHKQPHSNIKTPRTLLVQRPYDVTEDVQYQQETSVSQKLYVIAAIVKIIYYIFEMKWSKEKNLLTAVNEGTIYNEIQLL